MQETASTSPVKFKVLSPFGFSSSNTPPKTKIKKLKCSLEATSKFQWSSNVHLLEIFSKKGKEERKQGNGLKCTSDLEYGNYICFY